MPCFPACRTGQPVLDPAVSEPQVVLLQYVFAHAAVWGIGGCLAQSCWDAWDKVARGVFEGFANYPSGAGNVFDYFVDMRG
jgi:dynein heavy chain